MATRVLALGLLAIVAGATVTAPVQAQTQAEELILTSKLAIDLANQALTDAALPIGALLGRIGPSGSMASDRHGFGYLAVSGGIVGLPFKMTNPDYTIYKELGRPEMVDGAAATLFADFEIGLFRGAQTRGFENVGAIDLLLRYGLTVGDQENINETDIDFGTVMSTLEPIYGAGLRIGLLRGGKLPTLSVSFGFNKFQERVFGFKGDVEGNPIAVRLSLEQVSSYFRFEAAKRLSFLTLFAGAGIMNHDMESGYRADIVVTDSGSSLSATVSDGVVVDQTDRLLFGGIELFSSAPIRLGGEAGILDDTAFGSVSLRLVPMGR